MYVFHFPENLQTSFRREPLQIPTVGIHAQTPSLDPSFITDILKALHIRDCLALTLHFFLQILLHLFPDL